MPLHKTLISLLSLCSLSLMASCADRERINCPRTKNQVATRTTEYPTIPTTTIAPEGRCQ